MKPHETEQERQARLLRNRMRRLIRVRSGDFGRTRPFPTPEQASRPPKPHAGPLPFTAMREQVITDLRGKIKNLIEELRFWDLTDAERQDIIEAFRSAMLEERRR